MNVGLRRKDRNPFHLHAALELIISGTLDDLTTDEAPRPRLTIARVWLIRFHAVWRAVLRMHFGASEQLLLRMLELIYMWSLAKY